ncbi:MAG TPA: hypothetical protein VLB82_09305 [Thermodesulfobacteriota bacterium]|nr:hypothetical protein [Thermodesulfobacteriota bacterium]
MYFYISSKKSSKYFYNYRICGTSLYSDTGIRELTAFHKGKTLNNIDSSSPIKQTGDFDLVYNGPGFIADKIREVRLYSRKSQYKLFIKDIATLIIDYSSENKIIYLLQTDTADISLLIEALLGPALILCLALDGIFCFHASAVKYKNKALLFIGRSGAGKSTLAEYLKNYSEGKIIRLADDIAPVKMENNIAYIMPHFPQLKLPDEKQYPVKSSQKLEISAIYHLKKDNRRNSIYIKELNSTEKALTIISNTVASRLFDGSLNKDHIRFSTDLANAVSLNNMVYPHCKVILNNILNQIIKKQ